MVKIMNNTKSNYKLIASDLDWSIIYNSNKMNKDNLIALHDYLNKGYPFVVITGRPLFTSLALLKHLDLMKYPSFHFIGYNGALYYHPYTNTKKYSSKKIKKEEIYKIQEICDEYKCNLLCYHSEKVFINHEYFYNDKSTSLDRLPLNRLNNIKDMNKNCIKCIVASDTGRLMKIQKILKPLFPNLDFYLSQKYYLEVMVKSINKGTALLDFINKLNISNNDVITIGDSNTDLFMFQAVKKSFAVDNANEEIKKAASEVCLSCFDDNLKQIIDKYFD